jgi:hypothetical protein
MKFLTKTIFILVPILIVGIIVFNISAYNNVEVVKATVTDKERIIDRSGDNIESFYLVYTDKGTFKLEDDFFRGNFYSSDVYGKIKRDSTYTFKVAGYRIGFMSSYPNIIEIK